LEGERRFKSREKKRQLFNAKKKRSGSFISIRGRKENAGTSSSEKKGKRKQEGSEAEEEGVFSEKKGEPSSCGGKGKRKQGRNSIFSKKGEGRKLGRTGKEKKLSGMGRDTMALLRNVKKEPW